MAKSKKTKVKKLCTMCEIEKDPIKEFYQHPSILYSDNRLPVCKDCLESRAKIDENYSIINLMRMIDRPYIHEEWMASLSYNNPFREYMRRLAMRQNRELTYAQSQFDTSNNTSTDSNQNETSVTQNAEQYGNELLIKWGTGYSNLEMQQLEKFFNDMTRANDITTPQHKAQLELLCKVYLEQNKALAEKRFTDFKNLNNQYNQILRDSGFRPIDRQSAGESAGIRTFSQIWEEIERDGFIKPVEITETQDIIDKTIMYMGNYTRKLLNMNSMSEPPKDTPRAEGDDD